MTNNPQTPDLTITQLAVVANNTLDRHFEIDALDTV
jgi:hypothetical protein